MALGTAFGLGSGNPPDRLLVGLAVLGSPIPPYGALFLAVWRGREAEASELIEATMRCCAGTRESG